MSISLKIISYHRHTPGQQEIFKSDRDAFTIGRNDENDWAIPDPQRFLSGVHCRVHAESGRYYLTDTSTNGVFLNGAEVRMQRNDTTALRHHDKFRIGDYEFEVLIDDSFSSGADTDADDFDDNPFDDHATVIGQTEPSDEFEDDLDDPFSDPVPPQSPSDRHADFEKDINTPLEHYDNSPMAVNAISIGSLLDLDDLDDEEDEQISAESLREKHSPLNDAFKPSNRIESPAKPDQSVDFDQSFDIDIPDDWDETTGMLKVPQADDDEEASEQAAPLADDFELDDDFEFSGGTSEASDDSIALPDEWADALDIFNDEDEPPAPAASEAAEPVLPPAESQSHEPPSHAASGPAEPAKAAAVDVPAAIEKIPEPPPAVIEPPPAVAAAPAATTTATPAARSHSGGALAAFATGAGLQPEDLAGVDEAVFFEQVGGMLAEFTDGLVQTLSGRTHIKSEFRLDQTMIRPVENNPLKFSTSKTNTLKQLLSQRDTAYMTGTKAVKEGFDDVNAHQMAVVAGMEAALQDILKRFNPDALEKRLSSASILDSILPGGKKAKYWEMFKLLFDQIAGEAEDDFQQLFGSKFSRAYEQQLDRLKNKH